MGPRRVLRIVAVLAVLVSALAAAAAWRLSRGPVDLALLAPRVEAALSRPEAGYRVEMGSVEAAWAGWKRLLRFKVSDARLVTLEGRPLVETQGLEFALSASALLEGRIAPRDVELLGVSAAVRRRADGTLALLAAPAAETAGRPQEIDLGGLLAAGAAGSGAGLADLGVRGAALVVVDDIMETEWSVPRLDLAFRTGGEGTVAEGAASLRLAGAEADIGFTLSPSGTAGGPSLSVRLDGLRPRDAAAAHPLLALAGALTTPLSGSIGVHFAPDYAVDALEADLRGAGGALADPQDAGRSVPVEGLVIQARAVDGLTRLEIEAVEIRALGHTARLSGGGARREGAVSAFFHLEDLPPALLAPLLPPRLAAAAAFLDAPVSGTVAGTLDPNFRPLALDLGLTLGAGGLHTAGPQSEAIALKGGGALIQADLAAGQVLVESLALELGRGRIEASGGGKRGDAGWHVHLEGKAAAVPVDDLRLLWPPGVGSPGAREWVLSNVGKGLIDEARIAASADMALEPGLAFAAPAIDGSVSFSGVTARYWQPLPPFEDIGGSAAFDTQSFRLALSGGVSRGIAVADAKLDLLGLDREEPPARLAADVRFEGPLDRVLEVLDREPLGYARYLGTDPAELGGDAAFRLRVGLPLLAALALDDIALEAEGEAVNARVPVAALKAGLEGARIEVKVDKQHVSVSGGGLLDGRPAAFDFEQWFSRRDPVETIYRLRTTLDEKRQARLGFDPAPYVAGPVEIDLAATENRDDTAGYTLKAGLGGAEIRLEPLRWTKPAGEPAWLEASLRTGPDGLLEASSVAAAGPGLELAGRGRFDTAAGRLLEASLERLRVGERTDLAVHVAPLPDGAVSIRAKGPSVDLAPFLDGAGGERGEQGGQAGLERLVVRLDADRAWLGGESPLYGVAAGVRLEGGRLSQAEANARTANGRAVSASLQPGRGKAALKVDAEDTGALLAALGWYRNMRGGLLRLKAEGPVAARDNYRGSVIIKDFRIRDAPVLTRLLAAASITGIGDALSSDAGLQFERLETPLAVQGRKIAFGPGRAYGTAIGVSFQGEFDRDRETVALDGLLAPMYFVSRVLGKIPLLGDLLTGGGEGLFAAYYEMSGPAADPRTGVNPLTVLAPGVLRRLFGPLLGAGGRDWTPDDDAAGSLPGQ